MGQQVPSTNRRIFSAVITANRHIRQRFYRLRLEFSETAAEAFAEARPGQFAQLDLTGTALPPPKAIPEDLVDSSHRGILLRRPFSFCDVTAKDNKTSVEILYCVVGPASLRMTTLSSGNSISVIGPLGNGFSVPDGKKAALLVAGGMGAGPLIYLAKVLNNQFSGIEAIVFAGAKTAEELPFEGRLDEISQQLGFSLAEFVRYGVKSRVATDDGSAGFQGLVTDCLSKWLGRTRLSAKDMIIYSCGPEAMLARMAKIAREKNIDCQISMERMMACGFGVCQSCAVECRATDSNETAYKLCCKDGPVFDTREVVFSL